MGREPLHETANDQATPRTSAIWGLLTAIAVVVGIALLIDTSFSSSATYDEVAYLRVAARWWRTGDQAEISRMGSPLTFWKLQQVPVYFLLDQLGRREWIDDPIEHQRDLLPIVRSGSCWIWLVALLLTAAWSRNQYGPRAMALAAWLFALSPNLIAHGALATMELPLIAATTAMFWLFWRFLETKRWHWFWLAAAVGGLAFSCKYTAIVIPPILAAVWCVVRWRRGERVPLRIAARVGVGMLGFLAIMMVSNVIVTAGTRIPLSTLRGHHPTIEKWLGSTAAAHVARLYETPLPQDWVGFATQSHHQASGGASYLWGERRMTGWWYYYLVALAFKVPITFWLLAGTRLANPPRGNWGLDARSRSQCGLMPLVLVLYLAITAVGSSRNYGLRYLLPLAPLAIVWISALAEIRGRLFRRMAIVAGLGGYVVALAAIHPHELTYFNILAGGPRGGRHILADSNLDWGQGLTSLARLQNKQPEFRDLTLFYFGDTRPPHYGVAGTCYVINAIGDYSSLPHLDQVKTGYVAVSASLQWGPWGPEGHFRELDRLEPVRLTDDTTITIYRTSDLAVRLESSPTDRQTFLPR